MFPTTLDHPYHPSRGRRRGRNQLSNRDYICPCGKSYLSYPALFTHIKIKHNGRAPGQVIKPRSENANRRGRPRAKEVYDSESDTEDFAANSINRLCDFITSVQRWDDNGKFKEIYMKNEFYQSYVNFNPQEQEPKYDQAEQLYEQTCDNVFCECLTEINKRFNEPYHFDVLFIFFVMMARCINEEAAEEDSEIENSKKAVESESVKSLVGLANKFYLNWLPKYRVEYHLESVPLFTLTSVGKLMEHFFHWLTTKKYIGFKLKMKESYFGKGQN